MGRRGVESADVVDRPQLKGIIRMAQRLTKQGDAMRDMVLVLEPLVPGLRRFARALVQDASNADDLVQDCLERAVSRWHQRNPDGSAKAWLFAILVNLTRDRQRRDRRRGPHVTVDDLAPGALVQSATQEDALSAQDVLRSIDLLSDDQRAVMLLVSVEDLSYAEAAAALGVPIGTVMSRLARGRERLRRILDGATVGVTQLRSVK